jgi:hypothetical protein
MGDLTIDDTVAVALAARKQRAGDRAIEILVLNASIPMIAWAFRSGAARARV